MNMDALKFRVWDSETKEYNHNPDAFLTKNGCFATYQKPTYIVHNPIIDRYIIEQCTGLQDENGNLIYIGDIIKCGERTTTVSYANDENLIDGIYPFNLYHDCGDECHCQLRDFPEYACEIIGNIHDKKD